MREIKDLTLGSGSEVEGEVTDWQFGGRRMNLMVFKFELSI